MLQESCACEGDSLEHYRARGLYGISHRWCDNHVSKGQQDDVTARRRSGGVLSPLAGEGRGDGGKDALEEEAMQVAC